MYHCTVAVARYSKFACSRTVYLKIWLYNNLEMFTYLTMIFTRHGFSGGGGGGVRVGCALTVKVPLIATRQAEMYGQADFSGGGGRHH